MNSKKQPSKRFKNKRRYNARIKKFIENYKEPKANFNDQSIYVIFEERKNAYWRIENWLSIRNFMVYCNYSSLHYFKTRGVRMAIHLKDIVFNPSFVNRDLATQISGKDLRHMWPVLNMLFKEIPNSAFKIIIIKL